MFLLDLLFHSALFLRFIHVDGWKHKVLRAECKINFGIFLRLNINDIIFILHISFVSNLMEEGIDYINKGSVEVL